MSRYRILLADDDQELAQLLRDFLTRDGFDVVLAHDADTAIAATRNETFDALVLDVMMPGRSGLDILKELEADRYPAPIFIISGQGDIPMAVEAIKGGALDFIEKPFDPVNIVRRVREALAGAGARAEARAQSVRAEDIAGSDTLTPREREVLVLISAGQSNKEAGRQLGISPRTIEVHRARVMEKLGAKNTADLMRIVLTG